MLRSDAAHSQTLLTPKARAVLVGAPPQPPLPAFRSPTREVAASDWSRTLRSPLRNPDYGGMHQPVVGLIQAVDSDSLDRVPDSGGAVLTPNPEAGGPPKRRRSYGS